MTSSLLISSTISKVTSWQLMVSFEEAVETFFSDFAIRKNKGDRDRYQLFGRTVGGRALKIIFQLKPGRVVRIITGWPI